MTQNNTQQPCIPTPPMTRTSYMMPFILYSPLHHGPTNNPTTPYTSANKNNNNNNNRGTPATPPPPRSGSRGMGGRQSSLYTAGTTSTQTQISQFAKSIKKDASVYWEFTNETQWHKWQQHFSIMCVAHECGEVINPMYMVPTEGSEEYELFQQNKYFYSLSYNQILRRNMEKH